MAAERADTLRSLGYEPSPKLAEIGMGGHAPLHLADLVETHARSCHQSGEQDVRERERRLREMLAEGAVSAVEGGHTAAVQPAAALGGRLAEADREEVGRVGGGQLLTTIAMQPASGGEGATVTTSRSPAAAGGVPRRHKTHEPHRNGDPPRLHTHLPQAKAGAVSGLC